jgi:small subunit ribosomal protein S15
VTITKEKKTQAVEKFRTHETDTGSPEVQIALLTKRIEELAKHFETNKKDHHSRIGLMRLVSQRKSLLSYLRKKDAARYSKLIKELDLRK